MPAYVIADVDVSDFEKYKNYIAVTPDIVAKHGGRFLVRGGEFAVLEGDMRPNRLVMIEFPDMAAARKFYESAEYTQARASRAGATRRFNMVVVQGV
jgi:uncharacterized protein (DUF1330 family)